MKWTAAKELRAAVCPVDGVSEPWLPCVIMFGRPAARVGSTLELLIDIDGSLRRGLDAVLPPGTTGPRCMRSVAIVGFNLTLT